MLALAIFLNEKDGLPHGSLNFITAHDGFTLRDLVSYNHKHNDANGEENRDGRNENYSYNHGIEGSQLDLADECQSAVEKRRVLSEKALLGSLLLSMVYRCCSLEMSLVTANMVITMAIAKITKSHG